jgi:hypothetical protein
MVLAVGVVATACNERDTSGSTSSTTVLAAIPSGSNATVRTSTTLPFEDEIDAVRDKLDAAGSDLCSVFAVTHEPLNVMPLNTQQVREAVDLLVRILDAMRAVAPAADASIYRTTAAELRREAEKADYSTTWIRSEKNHIALNNTAFVQATSRLEAKYQSSCKPQGATTAPGG